MLDNYSRSKYCWQYKESYFTVQIKNPLEPTLRKKRLSNIIWSEVDVKTNHFLMNLESRDEKIIMHIRHIRFDKKGDKNCLKN